MIHEAFSRERNALKTCKPCRKPDKITKPCFVFCCFCWGFVDEKVLLKLSLLLCLDGAMAKRSANGGTRTVRCGTIFVRLGGARFTQTTLLLSNNRLITLFFTTKPR